MQSALCSVYVDWSSSAIDYLLQLFDIEVQNRSVSLINKLRNDSTTKHSTLKKFKIFKMVPCHPIWATQNVWVLIAMGIDSSTAQYTCFWAMDVFHYTSWYHERFLCDRFHLLHSIMLNIKSAEKNNQQKIKFNTFLNLLLNKFKNKFYPERDKAIDKMIVKWKRYV